MQQLHVRLLHREWEGAFYLIPNTGWNACFLNRPTLQGIIGMSVDEEA